ncbi:MAG: hypothetical protein ABEN55_08515 [Bradymonadaceae bacterium]
MGDMTKQIRNVAIGVIVLGVIGTGAYVGWSVLSGEPKNADASAGDVDTEWTETEAEAEPPEDRTDGESESTKEPRAEKTDESETSEESAERNPENASDSETNVARAESDETATVPTTVNRVDETASEVADKQYPGQQPGRAPERKEYKPAVLQIVTNFNKADVTVNGLVLPAGGPYNVEVTYDGKKKAYTVSLRPYEVRVLMVELSGFKGGAPTAPQTASPSTSNNSANINNNQNDNSEKKGRVTVYSKPKGSIQVDGNPKKQKTPGTVEVSPGQHDIQVKFDDGNMSESKTVRVRKGSRIKLFFRKKD